MDHALERAQARARPGLARAGRIRRPVFPVRRLPDALRPDRTGPALDRLHREDQPGRLYRDDGYGSDVQKMVCGGEDATPVALARAPATPSLRGAKRRSNPAFFAAAKLDCFASLAMTWKQRSLAS